MLGLSPLVALTTLSLIGSTLGISYDPVRAEKLAHFTAAVYCVDAETFGDAYEELVYDWDCNTCGYIAENTNIVSIYPFMSWLDVEGMITYDDDNNVITVAFAGTDPTEITDILTDLNLIRVEYPPCGGFWFWEDDCTVHNGFYTTFKTVANTVYNEVLRLKNKYNNPTIEITGHSLGGAMAILCALDLVENHAVSIEPDYVYTFGQPRVGDDEFVEHYNNVVGDKTIRVTHKKDPVPLVPWKSFGWNYLHGPREVYYAGDSDGAYTECNGSGEDPTCIQQHNWWEVLLNIFIISDHLDYLGVDFFSAVLECNFSPNDVDLSNKTGNGTYFTLITDDGSGDDGSDDITVNFTQHSVFGIELDWSEYGDDYSYTASEMEESIGIQTMVIYALKEAAVEVRIDLKEDYEIECSIVNMTQQDDDKVLIFVQVSFETERQLNGFYFDLSYVLEYMTSNLKTVLGVTSDTTATTTETPQTSTVGETQTTESPNNMETTNGCDCSCGGENVAEASQKEKEDEDDIPMQYIIAGVVAVLVIVMIGGLYYYKMNNFEKGGRSGKKEREGSRALSDQDQNKNKMARVTSNEVWSPTMGASSPNLSVQQSPNFGANFSSSSLSAN